MKLGYFLATEEFTPAELIRQAQLAERAGFDSLWISDHFHPWTSEQGQSPFVWSVIAALSQVTRLPVTTAVTCPTTRIHPVIIAQAAATSSVMLEGRFRLGVGTGEALNEHIFGDPWPSAPVRLEMLDEAIEVIRLLHRGGNVNHQGKHYTVNNAQIWTLPEQPTPIHMSGFGPRSVRMAARVADGYICMAPNAEFVRMFRENGGGDKPVHGGLKVCWSASEDGGVDLARHIWPNERLPGELPQVLPTTRHVEQAATLVTSDMVRSAVPAGPDPERHLEAIMDFARAGFDELYVQQIGPNQEVFFDSYARTVLPRVRQVATR